MRFSPAKTTCGPGACWLGRVGLARGSVARCKQIVWFAVVSVCQRAELWQTGRVLSSVARQRSPRSRSGTLPSVGGSTTPTAHQSAPEAGLAAKPEQACLLSFGLCGLTTGRCSSCFQPLLQQGLLCPNFQPTCLPGALRAHPGGPHRLRTLPVCSGGHSLHGLPG